MNLNEFFSSLNGRFIDVDGAGSATNKNQCVDLVKAYCNRVFGVLLASMNGYGDAWEYYDNFSKKTSLTPYFTKIAYTKGMQFKAGDIVAWNKSINKAGAGHIAVATGKYTSTTVETFDQNFPSGSPCKYVTHNNNLINGVLRPKDQSKVTGGASSSDKPLAGTGAYPAPAVWNNGSTKEAVYYESTLSTELGSLAAKEAAKCYSKAGNAYLVVYNLDGTSKHKAGFVEYAGGVSKAPPESKTWKNGSTAEVVYADTAKKTKVGSLNPNETAYGLGNIDGMYLVLYKVDGKAQYKCGFVDYNGGL